MSKSAFSPSPVPPPNGTDNYPIPHMKGGTLVLKMVFMAFNLVFVVFLYRVTYYNLGTLPTRFHMESVNQF